MCSGVWARTWLKWHIDYNVTLVYVNARKKCDPTNATTQMRMNNNNDERGKEKK